MDARLWYLLVTVFALLALLAMLAREERRDLREFGPGPAQHPRHDRQFDTQPLPVITTLPSRAPRDRAR